MIQEIIRAIALIICSLFSAIAFSQPPQYQTAPGAAPYDCESCNYGGPVYEENIGAHQGYFEQGELVGYSPRPLARVRNVASALRPQGRFADRDFSYGRPSDVIRAPYIDGRCGDCNWGPVYLSIFAGVAFIDNFDSRFTFDNGNAGEIGVRETGFSTLDGGAAGASIGRYFYRQARFEFEYTFRENGVGDMTEFTFDDILATPQINDTLVSSVVSEADGNIESSSFMWNMIFDLQPRTVGCMNGYLGGGIGVLLVDSDIATPTAMFNINDTSLAFQGIAGINFPYREHVDFFTEYRYLGADSISVNRADLAGGVDSLGAFRFDSHSLVIGLRFLR